LYIGSEQALHRIPAIHWETRYWYISTWINMLLQVWDQLKYP